MFVYDHHFWAPYTRTRGSEWQVRIYPVIKKPMKVAGHYINHIIGSLSATVEPLINYGSLLVLLCKVVTVEIGISTLTCVGKPYIGQFAIRHLINFPPVIFNPFKLSQSCFTSNRNYSYQP